MFKLNVYRTLTLLEYSHSRELRIVPPVISGGEEGVHDDQVGEAVGDVLDDGEAGHAAPVLAHERHVGQVEVLD